jgi:chloramphenicol 3-O-phosphotransferase
MTSAQDAGGPGQIVILNGAPRSGKSGIAHSIQETFGGVWVNLGVGVSRLATPSGCQPASVFAREANAPTSRP